MISGKRLKGRAGAMTKVLVGHGKLRALFRQMREPSYSSPGIGSGPISLALLL
jgi:hypothetical protein